MKKRKKISDGGENTMNIDIQYVLKQCPIYCNLYGNMYLNRSSVPWM